MKRAPESFSTPRRAFCVADVVESRRVTEALLPSTLSVSSRLRLETVGREQSPPRGFAPADYYREEKE